MEDRRGERDVSVFEGERVHCSLLSDYTSDRKPKWPLDCHFRGLVGAGGGWEGNALKVLSGHYIRSDIFHLFSP